MMAAIAAAGYRITATTSFEHGRRALSERPDLLVAAVRLGRYNGLQLVIRGRTINPGLRAIVLADYPDVVMQREAEQAGAVYLETPVDGTRLVQEIAHALSGVR